jgi:hypothetical protein
MKLVIEFSSLLELSVLFQSENFNFLIGRLSDVKGAGFESARVRFVAGIIIGKLKAEKHFFAVLEFLKENNNKDVYLRHAGIYALDHVVLSYDLIVLP